MQLIGRTVSPFVRRVAATLNLYGMPFENLPYATNTHAAEVARYNPLGRIPALVTDAGEVVVDSAVILDWLDHQVGPGRALTPLAGPERLAVTRLLALAVGAAERLVQAFYEERRRPAEKVWPEQVEKLHAQVRGGLDPLEAALGGEWLAIGRITQADVTTTCVLDSVEHLAPALARDRYPRLKGLRDRVNAIPAVGATKFKA